MRSLAEELAAGREALLAAAARVDDGALALPTRNPDWAVRDVLAHVLASDANVIALLEGAVRADATPEARSDEYEADMARWASAPAASLVAALRERGERWRALLGELPDGALELRAASWWTGPTTLGHLLGDYRTHDAEHAEDVRLALDG